MRRASTNAPQAPTGARRHKHPLQRALGIILLGILAAVVAIGVVVGLAVSAFGQAAFGGGGCGPRAEIARHLERKFGERLLFAGPTDSGNAMEIYVSASGSWTIVVVVPNGTACLVASGEAFEAVPAAARGYGS